MKQINKKLQEILKSSPIYRNNRKEAVIEYIWQTYEGDANDLLGFERVIRNSVNIDTLVREVAMMQNSKDENGFYIYPGCQPDLFVKAKRIFCEKKAREHYSFLERVKNYFLN